MATVLWLGGTSTDVSVGANWVGGSVPASGDAAKWVGITTYAPSSGTFTNPVAIFEVTEGAGTATSRDVGSPSSPLTLSAIATSCRFANRGNVYVTSSGTVAKAFFEMGNNGTVVISGGTWTNITAVNVDVQIGASAVVTEYDSIGSRAAIAGNATAITSLTGTGHITVENRNITTANLDGPTAFLVTKGTTAITTANVIAGATLNHQASGNITLANLRGLGSTLTPVGSPNRTGTPATITLVTVWSGAKFVQSVAGYTLSATVEYKGPQSTTSVPPAS